MTDADLGAVEFRVKAAVPRSRTPLTDRDAAMIPAGEPVFAVNGYKTSFRLAARHDGGLFLYEATPHPAARRGADLIGLERVVGIGLYSDGEGYGPLARIEDRSRVDALVRSIAIAPVDLAPPWGTAGSGGRFVFMAFEFADGTRTVRGYNGGRGALSDVIFPEEAFRTTIDAIMRSTACAPSCWP